MDSKAMAQMSIADALRQHNNSDEEDMHLPQTKYLNNP